MFWEYPDPPLWEGETVFILGGGPSLHGVDLKKIEDEKIIGINESYTFGDFVDFTFIGNNRYYKKHKERLAEEYGGHVVCAGGKSKNDPNIYTVYKDNGAFTMKPGRIGMANNSGIGAINLAAQLGAEQIVLLGYDMTIEKGNNWHKNNIYVTQYKRIITENYYNKIRNIISTKVVDHLYKRGIHVVNCTKGTKLDCFPIMDLDEFLEDYHQKSVFIEEE